MTSSGDDPGKVQNPAAQSGEDRERAPPPADWNARRPRHPALRLNLFPIDGTADSQGRSNTKDTKDTKTAHVCAVAQTAARGSREIDPSMVIRTDANRRAFLEYLKT